MTSEKADLEKRSNYQKFQTGNPVVCWMFNRFYKKIADIIEGHSPSLILDAGCGEGETLVRLNGLLPQKLIGFDVNETSVKETQKRFSQYQFSVEDIYNLPYDSRSFDLVICFEVLEHLEKPDKAIQELIRVAKSNLLFSVPYEPYFQIGSLLRGKYLKSFGNHPEHIQSWNPKTFHDFLTSNDVTNVQVDIAFPWLIGHCALPAR